MFHCHDAISAKANVIAGPRDRVLALRDQENEFNDSIDTTSS
jgi:hypothetical protein